jgi:signal transduction histidine kinase
MERMDFDQWKGREVARLLALVETQRRYYQEMVAELPVALVVLAADRSVVSANRAFRQLFGVRIEELRRKSIEQILPSDVLIEKIRDVTVNGIPQPGFLLRREEKLLRISILPIRNWDEEMEMETLLMVADVTGVPSGQAPVRAAAAPVVASPEAAPVAASPAVPAFPTATLPAVLWRADASTLVFKQVTGASEDLLGYPAAPWLETLDFFAKRIHPEDREAVLSHYRTAIASAGEASAEFRILSATGETVWCRETVRLSEPGTLSGILTRIALRKQLEDQRIAAERNSALHGLSARLAHALNNPLMIITGYAEELLHGLEPGNPRRADVERILEATQRVAGVTGQLLQFTRKHASLPHRIDLAALLSSLEEKIAEAAGEGVILDLTATAPLWALGNGEQLEEILLALVSAAREDARDRTRLHIACDTTTITELLEAGRPLQPGVYVRLTVHDNGRDMAAEKRRAVFESIVTGDPRSSGENAAAALARAYAVVREWGGDIVFQSESFRGSTFMLYLPLAEAGPIPEARPRIVAERQPAPQAQQVPQVPKPEPLRETILVVDDEPGIRALVAKILRRERYLVLEAGTAMEAVTVALTHGAPIHLLLTDVMLPDRNGRQLAEQLVETMPGVKVLYISGFTGDQSVRTGEFPPSSRFLQKPFMLGALVNAVREALDA